MSINKDALKDRVMNNAVDVADQIMAPNQYGYDPSLKPIAYDPASAKKLLAEAGLAGGYGFELTIINNPQQRRVGEVIQGMAKEAGFNITLRPSEFASALKDNDDGKHQAFLIGLRIVSLHLSIGALLTLEYSAIPQKSPRISLTAVNSDSISGSNWSPR